MPRPIGDLLLACLEPDPAKRPTPGEVADELAPVLGQLPQGSLGGFKAALSRR